MEETLMGRSLRAIRFEIQTMAHLERLGVDPLIRIEQALGDIAEEAEALEAKLVSVMEKLEQLEASGLLRVADDLKKAREHSAIEREGDR